MEKEIVKEYQKGDLTVVWKPNTCIHSEKCFKGLSSVFNPNNRPWVNVDGADAETIKKQIDTCPSGALSYKVAGQAEEVVVEDEQLVEVAPNGPLMVYGNIKVKTPDGKEATKNRVTAFCRCGASGNKPYCDGSHQKVGFEG